MARMLNRCFEIRILVRSQRGHPLPAICGQFETEEYRFHLHSDPQPPGHHVPL